MNALDAAHRTVHAYPGGSESLGPRLNMSPAVLRSKVNSNVKTHRLALDEADEIMGVTGDYQILQALAATHGFALRRLDEPTVGPGSVIDGVLALNTANGDLSKVIAEAIADNVITEHEMREIQAAAASATGVIIALINRLRSVSGKRHLGAVA